MTTNEDVYRLIALAKRDAELCLDLMATIDQVQRCVHQLRQAHEARAQLAQLPPETLRKALEARG